MLWKRVISLVLFNTFPSKQDEKKWGETAWRSYSAPTATNGKVHPEGGKEWQKIRSASHTLWRRWVETKERSKTWEVAENSRCRFTDLIIEQKGAGDAEKQIWFFFINIKPR